MRWIDEQCFPCQWKGAPDWNPRYQDPEEKPDALEDDFHNISKLNTGILCYFVLLL